MTKFYSITDPIMYEGPDSKNALAYRWYNPKQKVLGKSMAEHLRFAVCYWHTLCWPGTDPFGGETFNRQWHQMRYCQPKAIHHHHHHLKVSPN